MRPVVALVLLPMLAACAAGKGRVEVMVDNVKPLDALVLGGVLAAAYEVSGRSVWEAETTPAGANRFRVTLRRHRFADAGDGEAPLLFRRHAERIAAVNLCAEVRIVEFSERYDKLLVGAQRVAEGLVECVKA